jgi:hypothetical protein
MTVTADGLKRTNGGALHVTFEGNVGAITGGSITTVSGVPYVLAQSFVVATAAADTNENTLATITVPANTLGANGGLRILTQWSMTSSANNKTIRVRYSGAAGSQFGLVIATTRTGQNLVTHIVNANATNSQKGGSYGTDSSGQALNNQNVTASADTTASTTIVITGQKATAGETLSLEGYLVEVI